MPRTTDALKSREKSPEGAGDDEVFFPVPESHRIHLLLFDPDRSFAPGFRQILEQQGWRVSEVRSEASAESVAGKDVVNVVIKSYSRAKKRPGLMERLSGLCADTEFILVSPQATVRMAMEAVRRGAFDCLPLPCEPGQLVESIERALQHQLLAAENSVVLARLHARNPPDALSGDSGAMREVQDAIARVADTDVTVLLTGESGTGKEMIARRIHELSRRQDGPFVAVNCAALPDSLIESEFFGHVRGAFTGAVADKPGRFELARGGTLFLDEIGDLSPLGQADLLRVLEDGIFRPLGSHTTVQAHVRVLAATNRDLELGCLEGRFREDLLYRLNVITLHLPPLRDRPEDIPRLADNFVRHFCSKHRRPRKTLSPQLRNTLRTRIWRGNVRQLRNTIERMVLLAPERILMPTHLPPHLQDDPALVPADGFPPKMTLAEVEQEWIRRTLARCGNNRTEAARQLGISRRALHYKLKGCELPAATETSPGN
jgi:DNA-binding NtrC family response regulator